MVSGAFTLKQILGWDAGPGGKDPCCWCEAAARRDACYSGQREREGTCVPTAWPVCRGEDCESGWKSFNLIASCVRKIVNTVSCLVALCCNSQMNRACILPFPTAHEAQRLDSCVLVVSC